MGKKSTETTENKPKKESAGVTSKIKEPPGGTLKSQSDEKPKTATSSKEPPGGTFKSQSDEKPKTATSSSSSKATPSVEKDAFGRPACQGTEGVQCHESHKGFRKDDKDMTIKPDKDVKKSGRRFSEVDSEKTEGRSAYGKISEYCQNLRRQVTVEPGETPVVTSGASGTRGRTSFLGHPRLAQLAGRWLPAAGLYMVATAAVAVWVTEWGPIVNHIPYYKDKEKVIPLSPESPVPEFIPLVPEPPPEYYDELDDSPQDEPMELSPPESHHSPPEPQPSPPESQPSPPQSQPSPPQSQDPPSESHSK